MQKVTRINDVAIISAKENHYIINFLYMIKDEAINLLRNADLAEKSRTLLNIKIITYKRWVKKLCFLMMKLKNKNFIDINIQLFKKLFFI